MSEEKASTETDKTTDNENVPAPAEGDDGEFKITVRKLEMPVRPRGVLAE